MGQRYNGVLATAPPLRTAIIMARSREQPRTRMLLFAQILIAGYLAFGRGFAHIGFAAIYPAEVFIAASLLTGGAAWLALYFGELGRGRVVAVMATAFFAWGLFEVCRGLLGGYKVLDSLRGLATHYYVFLFFIGWELSRHADPRWFVRMVHRTAGWVAAGGILIALISHFAGENSPIALFLSPPAMPAYTATALLAFAPALGLSFYPLFGGNILALLLNPGRAAWLSMIAGAALVIRGAGRVVIQRLLAISVLLVALIVFVGPLLPVTEGRGGTLSPRWIAARMLTLVDSDAAERMIAETGSPADMTEIRAIAGTKEWRKRFWEATLNSLDTDTLWVIGHGYGFSLGTLIHEDVRTPHNFSIYLLGYTGCIGLALYLGLLLAFYSAIRGLPRSPYRSFLFGQLAVTLIVAAFGNGLETPFVAVPFYLVMGLAYGYARRGNRA